MLEQLKNISQRQFYTQYKSYSSSKRSLGEYKRLKVDAGVALFCKEVYQPYHATINPVFFMPIPHRPNSGSTDENIETRQGF